MTFTILIISSKSTTSRRAITRVVRLSSPLTSRAMEFSYHHPEPEKHEAARGWLGELRRHLDGGPLHQPELPCVSKW